LRRHLGEKASFVRSRVTAEKDTLVKRVMLSLADDWVQRNRRSSH
jgi:hypothetical protein